MGLFGVISVIVLYSLGLVLAFFVVMKRLGVGIIGFVERIESALRSATSTDTSQIRAIMESQADKIAQVERDLESQKQKLNSHIQRAYKLYGLEREDGDFKRDIEELKQLVETQHVIQAPYKPNETHYRPTPEAPY
jgi:hypothetical protein